MTRYRWSVGSSVVVALALIAGCGQKGGLIAVKRPGDAASSAAHTSATAPLPPPEPLEPPTPRTAPR